MEIRSRLKGSHIRLPWFAGAIGKGGITGCAVACLFYQSPYGLLLLPVCITVAILKEKKRKERAEAEREQQLFSEYLSFLREALQVGYSLEQAVGEAKKGLLTTYKGEEPFLVSVTHMQHKMQLGLAVEAAFSEMAEESPCEDIRDFSEVLFIAKRTGGAVQRVIAGTERIIRDKQETLRYIRSALHSREYEVKVMKGMPFAMLLYLNLFMADFLQPLYHNAFGVCVMSAVLAAYFILCSLADRIVSVSL